MVTGRAEHRQRTLPGICILFFITLATLTVHAVISSTAAAAPKVTGLTASPDPYNPERNKRLKITFKLSESAHIKVKVVKTRILMRKSRTMGAGTVSFSWDGRKRSGNKANSGTYKLVVHAYSRSGRSRKTASFTVSRQNPRAPLDTGSILAEHIANSVITSLHIKDGTIQVSDLADGVIAALSLTTGAVKTEHLADGAVTAAKLAAGSVTAAKLAADSVTSSSIADDAVGSSEITTDAVDAAEIAAGAVGSSEIAAGAVGSSEIAAGAVTSADVATDSLKNSNLAPNSVGSSEIATNAVGSDEISDLSLQIGDIAALNGSVTIDPPNISAYSCSNVNVGISGVLSNNQSFVNPPSTLEAGLIAMPMLPTAADTLIVRICNVTNALINGAPLSWRYFITR